MATATEQLLKDHRMIRKLLQGLRPGAPRFPETFKTLRRVVLAHAWFEDEFLMPAIKREELIFSAFWREISQEHKDIDSLLTGIAEQGTRPKKSLEASFLTLRTLLETHFAKEEDALFPLTERALSRSKLVELAQRMEERKSEVRPFAP